MLFEIRRKQTNLLRRIRGLGSPSSGSSGGAFPCTFKGLLSTFIGDNEIKTATVTVTKTTLIV